MRRSSKKGEQQTFAHHNTNRLGRNPDCGGGEHFANRIRSVRYLLSVLGVATIPIHRLPRGTGVANKFIIPPRFRSLNTYTLKDLDYLFPNTEITGAPAVPLAPILTGYRPQLLSSRPVASRLLLGSL